MASRNFCNSSLSLSASRNVVGFVLPKDSGQWVGSAREHQSARARAFPNYLCKAPVQWAVLVVVVILRYIPIYTILIHTRLICVLSVKTRQSSWSLLNYRRHFLSALNYLFRLCGKRLIPFFRIQVKYTCKTVRIDDATMQNQSKCSQTINSIIFLDWLFPHRLNFPVLYSLLLTNIGGA